MTMTYDSLVEQVKSYFDRSDASTIAQIPNFIDLAVESIWRELKEIGLETYAVGNMITNEPVIPKPARWRRTVSINYGHGTTTLTAGNNRKTLELRPYELCISYWPNRAAVEAPLFYADYGYYNLLICPTPAADYPFEIVYIGPPPALNSTEQMNWLTNYAPDVLLYGTLLTGTPYLKDDDRIPMWKEKYMSGIQSLTYNDDERLNNKGTN